jgi:hypothetical protein
MTDCKSGVLLTYYLVINILPTVRDAGLGYLEQLGTLGSHPTIRPSFPKGGGCERTPYDLTESGAFVLL